MPPEKQVTKPMIAAIEKKAPIQHKPRSSQGRAGLRRKVKISISPYPDKPTQVANQPNIHKHVKAMQPQLE